MAGLTTAVGRCGRAPAPARRGRRRQLPWRKLFLLPLLAVAFAPGHAPCSAEVFSETISASSCRHDVGQFTFQEQSEFAQQPSIDASVARVLICPVYVGWSGTMPSVSQIQTTLFQETAISENQAAIDECIGSLDMYFVVAPVSYYDPDRPCIAFMPDDELEDREAFQQVSLICTHSELCCGVRGCGLRAGVWDAGADEGSEPSLPVVVLLLRTQTAAGMTAW
jgi:hypothetical protein